MQDRIPQNSARIGLLALTFLAITLTFGRTLILTKPTAPSINNRAIELPNTIALSGWQTIDSQRITIPNLKDQDAIPNRRYRYLKDGTPIEVTVYHFASSNGDVKPTLQSLTDYLKSKAQLELDIRHKSQVGYYGVFVEQQQAHLSSCINGRGESTFTHLQFQRNRNLDVFSERPFLWLAGLSELRDTRCLLVHFQTPIQNKSPEQAYQLLEQAWTEWYQWWQPRLQSF